MKEQSERYEGTLSRRAGNDRSLRLAVGPVPCAARPKASTRGVKQRGICLRTAPKRGPCLGTSVTRPKLRRPPSTSPSEAPHRSPLARERRRQHRATVENEAHAWCCTSVDRPVLVAAAYVQTFGTEVLGPGAHFRELGLVSSPTRAVPARLRRGV